MILQNCRTLQGGNHFLELPGCSTLPSGARTSDSWGFEWFFTEVKENKPNSRNPPLLGMLLRLQPCRCTHMCVGVLHICVCVCMHLCVHMCTHVYTLHVCAHMCASFPHIQREIFLESQLWVVKALNLESEDLMWSIFWVNSSSYLLCHHGQVSNLS